MYRVETLRKRVPPPKFYAQAQARGDVNIREMSERIQSSCPVNKADVYAVLVALEDVVAEAIQNGEIVRLGDLCTLQVSLNGKGAVTEEDYDTSLIKRAKSTSVLTPCWQTPWLRLPSARCA